MAYKNNKIPTTKKKRKNKCNFVMANKRFRNKVNTVTKEISIKSLVCLFDTSNAMFITNALLKRKPEFEALLKSKLKSEELMELLKVLFHIYNLKNSRIRSQLLAATQSEEFINSIKNYIVHVKNDGDINGVIDLILHFVDVNINDVPISDVYYQRFDSLLKVFHDVQTDSRFCNTYLWTHELGSLLQKKLIHKNSTNYTLKELNVFPSAVDLFEKKDLIPNKINGKYRNAEEYLDITFKLLKEDFESSLREGLLQMKSELRGATKKENKEINVYNNVNVERVEIDKNPRNGVIHRIAFSITDEQLKQITMMNGSLLLFSIYSQFTNFIPATLIEDVKLQESEIDSCKVLKISVIGDPLQLKPYWQYTMIECRKFFGHYYPVLKALQSISTNSFPMAKYIINSDSRSSLPNYISTDTEYVIDNKPIKLFSNEPWPNNLMNLDHLQVNALRSALTHEVAIIHGPPGTGKTYITETIINVLIDNKSVLSSPILLISSRNNLVDYILESLVLKKRKVIRLGMQTKSVILKSCLFSNFVKSFGEKDIREKIDRVKKSLLWKVNQNDANIDKEVDCFQKEQDLYIELNQRNAAHQLLSEKIEIIGGTTEGCAKLRYMLGRLQPEVVIVENANEVLEAHVVAALSEGCKHLILIGDEKQFKPNVAHQNSSELYNLDVSLLERLARCGLEGSSRLTVQHRMRPDIAALISPGIYQEMMYHFEVINSPKVKGIKNNLFFIDHKIAEDRIKEDDVSYCNKHEGDMLLGLANYLLKQGYSTRDITILVPYASQQNYMIAVSQYFYQAEDEGSTCKKWVKKNLIAAKKYPLQNMEILIIDNYSGFENKIILLSLVRSCSAGIGFLSMSNRINVALSRAKYGLYIIGNMKTLIQDSDLWRSLNVVLKKQKAIGRSLHLECQTHKTIKVVFKKQDFEDVNSGGCNLQCNLTLDCGHTCKLQCHPILEKHSSYPCR